MLVDALALLVLGTLAVLLPLSPTYRTLLTRRSTGGTATPAGA